MVSSPSANSVVKIERLIKSGPCLLVTCIVIVLSFLKRDYCHSKTLLFNNNYIKLLKEFEIIMGFIFFVGSYASQGIFASWES